MDAFRHDLCNDQLHAAPGDEDTVNSLPVQHGKLDGVIVTRSFWKPTSEELALLNADGCVMLTVLSYTHAPLRLDAVP